MEWVTIRGEHVDEHDVVRREITRRADGSSVGAVACACGWKVEAGPLATMAEADEAVKVAWSSHLTTPGG